MRGMSSIWGAQSSAIGVIKLFKNNVLKIGYYNTPFLQPVFGAFVAHSETQSSPHP